MRDHATNELGRPNLETTRLVLRPFAIADARRVQELAGDSKIAETTATVPHPYLDGMAEEWIGKHDGWFKSGSSVQFAIVLKKSNELIGCIDLIGISKANQKAEVGYWVGVDFWNAGFCTEAMKAVVSYGFDSLNLNKITSRHMSTNPASGRVMQKAGLVQEGLLRQEFFKNGRFVDMYVYGILREDFERIVRP